MQIRSFLPTKVLALMAVGIIFFMQSCKEDLVLDETAQENQEILDYLREINFGEEPTGIVGNEIVFEDFVMEKADILMAMNEEVEESDIILGHGDLDNRQRIVSTMSALTKQNCLNGVKVWIAPSITNDLGANAYSQVVAAINEFKEARSTSNFSVNMQIVNSKNDATIRIVSDLDEAEIGSTTSFFYDFATYWKRVDSDPSNDNNPGPVGLAYLSSNGAAGGLISLNNNAGNASYFKSSVMHELGHTLGFRHTMTWDGHHIHGTSGRDDLSIMRPTAQTTGEFTDGDRKALKIIYPKSLNRPTNVSVQKHSSAVVRVNFDSTTDAYKSAYWLRVKRYTDGVPTGTYDVIARADGKTFIANHPPGVTTFKVRAMGYKKDVLSSWVDATGSVVF